MTDRDLEFERLTRRLSAASGMSLEAYKDKCLRRRIAVRMRACGAASYDDYLAFLDRNADELHRLQDALTINVTRFYRNPETWDALRAGPLPACWSEREGALRVWSAGCASGEEPYTIAMIVAELAEQSGRPDWLGRLAVDATDVDRESLERAAAGEYRAEAFQETPPAFVTRWTIPTPTGRQVRPELRRLVHVTRLDLAREGPLRPVYDLICCRNVVIYFDRPMQERLFEAFASHLAPGGLLVLGKVETLLGSARDRLTMIDTRERIYRRAA